MAVRIRLTRLGKNKKPVYRVVAADSRSPRDGKVLENLGYYRPLDEPMVLELNEDRVKYWLSVGAETTETLSRLLATKGLIEKPVRKSGTQGVSKKDRPKTDK